MTVTELDPKSVANETSLRCAQIPIFPPPGRQRVKKQIKRIWPRIPSPLQQAMLTAFTEDRWPLYVYGPAGVGKTCAALYAADRCADYVEYLDFAFLITDYVDAKCGRLVDDRYSVPPKVSSRQFGERLASHTLVIIDDWGTRDRVSDTHYEAAKMALEARQGRPLIVTSNLSLEAIDSLYDDRIASRLAAGLVCEVRGEDQRLRRP